MKRKRNKVSEAAEQLKGVATAIKNIESTAEHIKVKDTTLASKLPTINQALVNRIIKRAERGSFGLRRQSKPADITQFAQMSIETLSMCLVGAFHDKYDLIAIMTAAIEEMTIVNN